MGLPKGRTIIDKRWWIRGMFMSIANEFDESEMYPCDICKEGYPREDMIELPDGTLLCPDCFEAALAAADEEDL